MREGLQSDDFFLDTFCNTRNSYNDKLWLNFQKLLEVFGDSFVKCNEGDEHQYNVIKQKNYKVTKLP
jgi:hypothetical protein